MARYNDIPINHRVEIEEGKKEFKATAYQPTRSKAESSVAELKAPIAPTTISTWLDCAVVRARSQACRPEGHDASVERIARAGCAAHLFPSRLR